MAAQPELSQVFALDALVSAYKSVKMIEDEAAKKRFTFGAPEYPDPIYSGFKNGELMALANQVRDSIFDLLNMGSANDLPGFESAMDRALDTKAHTFITDVINGPCVVCGGKASEHPTHPSYTNPQGHHYYSDPLTQHCAMCGHPANEHLSHPSYSNGSDH